MVLWRTCSDTRYGCLVDACFPKYVLLFRFFALHYAIVASTFLITLSPLDVCYNQKFHKHDDQRLILDYLWAFQPHQAGSVRHLWKCWDIHRESPITHEPSIIEAADGFPSPYVPALFLGARSAGVSGIHKTMGKPEHELGSISTAVRPWGHSDPACALRRLEGDGSPHGTSSGAQLVKLVSIKRERSNEARPFWP